MESKLFELMRFQILTAALQEGSKQRLNDAYVYAWDEGVYPVQHDSASMHKPFKAQFAHSEEQVDQVAEFLDAKWLNDEPVSFYQLEDHFGGKGSRIMLLHVCRYLFLTELFDEALWSGLMANSQCPAEARSILRPYNRSDDIYFH